MGEGYPLQQKMLEQLDVTCKRMKMDPSFIKINSKWIKDLNVRPETIKLVEENLVGKLSDTEMGNDVLDMTSKAQLTKTNTDKWDYITLKSSAQQRNNQQDEKANYGMGENICRLYQIRSEYPECIKNKKPKNPIKKWARGLNDISLKMICKRPRST